MADRLLSEEQLKTEKGIDLTARTIRTLRLRGLFPQPIQVGFRKIAWRETDIDRWIATAPTAGKGVCK